MTILTALVYFVLSFYVYGATVVEVFVYYPSWIHVVNNWIPFKQGVDFRLICLYVIPTFLLYIPLTLMFWFRFDVIPKWAIVISILFFSIPAISTFMFQLPIQMQLARGWDKELYFSLVSHEWITRQIWVLLSFILNIWMLFKIFNQINKQLNSKE